MCVLVALGPRTAAASSRPTWRPRSPPLLAAGPELVLQRQVEVLQALDLCRWRTSSGPAARSEFSLDAQDLGLLDAAAVTSRGPPGRTCGRPCAPTTCNGVHRPLPVLHEGAESSACGDFRAIPNGIGGIEHRMDLMYPGVVTGRIPLPRWVELTSTTPARMFGLYGTQGRHPARRRRRHRDLRPARPHLDRRRRSPPHEHGPLGLGGLRDRRSRRPGDVAGDSDRGRAGYVGSKGHGQFLKRDLSQYLI